MVTRSFATLDDLKLYCQQKADEATGEMNLARAVRDAYLDAMARMQEIADPEKGVSNG